MPTRFARGGGLLPWSDAVGGGVVHPGRMDKPVAAAALTYGSIGVVSLARPAMVPALFGGTAPGPDARTEVRAVYGGLPLAIAAALATDRSAARPIGLLSAGMAAGRLAGIAVEGRRPRAATVFFLGLEAALAGLLLAPSGRG